MSINPPDWKIKEGSPPIDSIDIVDWKMTSQSKNSLPEVMFKERFINHCKNTSNSYKGFKFKSLDEYSKIERKGLNSIIHSKIINEIKNKLKYGRIKFTEK